MIGFSGPLAIVTIEQIPYKKLAFIDQSASFLMV